MAEPTIDRILRQQKWLDGVADRMQRWVGAVFKLLRSAGQPAKDFLHGTTFGHPLHPAVTDIPLGAWITGVIADYLAITSRIVPRGAGTVALAIGLAGALASVASGWTDFHETFGLERRTAVAHGLLMSSVFAVQSVSLVFRLVGVAGLYGPAVGLATAGLTMTALGMFLGGHVVYRFGTGVNRTAFVDEPKQPTIVGASEQFLEGKMQKVHANGMAVLVARLQGSLYAISNVCTHAGGPLDEGEIEGDIVTCPWHASRFDIRDGTILRGPATFPQPQLQVREHDGKVEVWLADSLH